MTPQNLAAWASTHDAYGRSPLMTAAALSMQWTDTERTFSSYKRAIYEEDDGVTGLTVSALAAVGSNSDLESVYQLCMQHPAVLMPAMTAQDMMNPQSVLVYRKRKLVEGNDRRNDLTILQMQINNPLLGELFIDMIINCKS